MPVSLLTYCFQLLVLLVNHGQSAGAKLPHMSLTQADPPEGLVKFKFKTCAIEYSGTDSNIEIRIPAEGGGDYDSWKQLDWPGHDDFEIGATDAYDITSRFWPVEDFAIRNTGNDGWCVSRIMVEDIEVVEGLPRWFQKECEQEAYGEIPCSSTFIFNSHPYEQPERAQVRIHVCDLPDAGTAANVYMMFPDVPDATWTRLHGENEDDFVQAHYRDFWVPSNGEEQTRIAFRMENSDSLCLDELYVDGIAITAGLPAWIEGNCAEPEYDGIPCASVAMNEGAGDAEAGGAGAGEGPYGAYSGAAGAAVGGEGTNATGPRIPVWSTWVGIARAEAEGRTTTKYDPYGGSLPPWMDTTTRPEETTTASTTTKPSKRTFVPLDRAPERSSTTTTIKEVRETTLQEVSTALPTTTDQAIITTLPEATTTWWPWYSLSTTYTMFAESTATTGAAFTTMQAPSTTTAGSGTTTGMPTTTYVAPPTTTSTAAPSTTMQTVTTTEFNMTTVNWTTTEWGNWSTTNLTAEGLEYELSTTATVVPTTTEAVTTIGTTTAFTTAATTIFTTTGTPATTEMRGVKFTFGPFGINPLDTTDTTAIMTTVSTSTTVSPPFLDVGLNTETTTRTTTTTATTTSTTSERSSTTTTTTTVTLAVFNFSIGGSDRVDSGGAVGVNLDTTTGEPTTTAEITTTAPFTGTTQVPTTTTSCVGEECEVWGFFCEVSNSNDDVCGFMNDNGTSHSATPCGWGCQPDQSGGVHCEWRCFTAEWAQEAEVPPSCGWKYTYETTLEEESLLATMNTDISILADYGCSWISRQQALTDHRCRWSCGSVQKTPKREFTCELKCENITDAYRDDTLWVLACYDTSYGVYPTTQPPIWPEGGYWEYTCATYPDGGDCGWLCDEDQGDCQWACTGIQEPITDVQRACSWTCRTDDICGWVCRAGEL